MKTEESLIIGSKMFFHALIERKSIQEIVDIGYELLGNPFQVVDVSYKVLAYTKNVEVDDPNWKKLLVAVMYLTI